MTPFYHAELPVNQPAVDCNDLIAPVSSDKRPSTLLAGDKQGDNEIGRSALLPTANCFRMCVLDVQLFLPFALYMWEHCLLYLPCI